MTDDRLADDDNEGLVGRRRLLWAVGALLLVAVAFAGWLGFRAQEAKSHLEQARTSAQRAKDALLKGDAQEASKAADEARAQAQSARDATHSVPWNIASVVPWLGSPFETGQQVSDVVLGLAGDVLKPATAVGEALSPDHLLRDGRIDVELLRQKEPDLTKIAADAARLDEQAKAIRDPEYVASLQDARTQLQRQTSDVAKLLDNTALAARVAPPMMGADGQRAYFMGFQTNAEARGTGGLLGGFGILHFDNGKPTVEQLGPNTELNKNFASIDLGPEFAEQYSYAAVSTDFRNSNLSAHFPYTAQIWKSMWVQQTGNDVDGVVAIDPIALSYILGAVGPVTMPDGEQVTKDNVVELTESTAYKRFPTDQVARKQYLQDIASEVVKKITGPVESPRALLDALGEAVSEGRISVWSATPAEQQALERTPLAHVIPDDAAPYANVVLNNLGGNKMDYYLRREIEYVADGCEGEKRNSTVTVRLKNVAPVNEPLPDYIAAMPGLVPEVASKVRAPRGTMLTSVRLVGTKDATLTSVIADGQKVPVFTGSERGHPTFEVQVFIPPGRSGELTFHLSEPTAEGEPRVPVQPLVDDVAPKVSVPACTK
ncbi:MAG: DUF4012 domain-containing protein [Fimbriimonadaceae bacterium]|nr:DUF4012 domain-containing protein [Fimbriimonadaceae bacterium]